ncbi:MAG: hypothetical protein OEX81_02190 [Candidatus Pacebacteria bacterium]|nr:hypothetical protein [Candidatus Paceibacterota bacterium]
MKKLVFSLLVLLLLFSPVVVTAASPIISQKESIIDEIAEVRRSYKGQLAEYRQANDQFIIAKGQYEKLNTLASLEVAVQDVRKVLSLRDQVLLSYLKIIELELLEADGINLEEKTIALEETKDLQRDFLAHKDLVDNAIDRVAVNQVADDFELLSPRITSLSSYASALLRVGKLQTIYDQSLTLVEATDPRNLTDEPSLKLNEKIRAHNEIKNLMTTLDFNLNFVWDEIKDSRITQQPSETNKLNASIYASLAQVLAFLEEILLDK